MNTMNNSQSVSNQNAYARQRDEYMWGMLCHLGAFAGFAFPFGNIVAPLVIWLIKKDESSFIDDQGKEALNFQISMTIYLIVSGILTIVLIGIPLLFALLLYDVVIIVIAAIRANEGIRFRYPGTIRFIL